MNVVCLVGRLTADPELKHTPSGIEVISFSIAVQGSIKAADGSYKADFINCVAWRNTAEFIGKYFRKGQMIGLNGTIQTRQYQEKDTGKNRTMFEVIVNNTYFIERKKDSGEKYNSNKDNSLDDFIEIVEDNGDLPF